jgi:hypothetical protein
MYRPLDYDLKEFRLLVIRPGEVHSLIGARLATYTFLSAALDGPEPSNDSHAPAYEALSYEWGDPKGKSQTILLNGQPFKISENLHQALQHMRPWMSSGVSL